MATKIGLGVPMPLLTPVTATWTVPFAAYYIFLQNRIVYHRIKNEQYMGDRISESDSDPLFVSTRCQLNFIENVPLAFIGAALAELNGANRKYLSMTLGAFFALRLAHAELGLMKRGSLGLGRPIAFYGTQAVVLGLAGWAGWLVKGYWEI